MRPSQKKKKILAEEKNLTYEISYGSVSTDTAVKRQRSNMSMG